ncbi:unnamed protein product [Nippostrongylus brasiliensis]|uniref:Uncharacterized protein n=1 Tax=Nippostrongylus brasiliensis TaxID=27835 RepID=A0A3P7B2R8_NIPBR|nr:unnamed protein product [Nippostrongylus brasiliensis]
MGRRRNEREIIELADHARQFFVSRHILQNTFECPPSDLQGSRRNQQYSGRSEALCCILVGPTSENPFPKKDWCKLSSALAAAARNGIKILAVAPPRGDGAYERNRIDMNETLELAKSVAVLAKQNIISYIPAIESAREPSHGPGARPRNSSSEKYSKEVLRDYFESLNTYLKGELDLPPWEEKITQPMAMPIQPQMYPFPFQGQYMMAPTGTYPREFSKSRGRGHFNHRRQDHFNHRFKRGNNSARFTNGWAGLPRAPDSPGVSSSGSSQGNGDCDLDSVAYELWLDNGA